MVSKIDIVLPISIVTVLKYKMLFQRRLEVGIICIMPFDELLSTWTPESAGMVWETPSVFCKDRHNIDTENLDR